MDYLVFFISFAYTVDKYLIPESRLCLLNHQNEAEKNISSIQLFVYEE